MAPPSIMGLILAAEIDSAVTKVEPEHREVPAIEGGEIRRLRLWRIDGKPVKLTATEVSEVGRRLEVSTWYFRDGEIVFASDAFARYAYSGGHLAEITEENGMVTETDPDGLRGREQVLRLQADEWLKEFGS